MHFIERTKNKLQRFFFFFLWIIWFYFYITRVRLCERSWGHQACVAYCILRRRTQASYVVLLEPMASKHVGFAHWIHANINDYRYYKENTIKKNGWWCRTGKGNHSFFCDRVDFGIHYCRTKNSGIHSYDLNLGEQIELIIKKSKK